MRKAFKAKIEKNGTIETRSRCYTVEALMQGSFHKYNGNN
ncbi:17362_t:CDS:2, partial [Racocetra fulgida]